MLDNLRRHPLPNGWASRYSAEFEQRMKALKRARRRARWQRLNPIYRHRRACQRRFEASEKRQRQALLELRFATTYVALLDTLPPQRRASLSSLLELYQALCLERSEP